jgi:hypothetical protein
MPPQSSSSTQPAPPATPALDTGVVGKKIHNAGRSVFSLGIFLTVLGIIASFGLGTVTGGERVEAAAYILMVIVVSIYWIMAGFQIKRDVSNARGALRTISMVIVTSVIVSVISIAMSIVRGKLGAGDFSIVLTLYLLVAQSRIKKLSGQ